MDHLEKYAGFLEGSVKIARPVKVVFDCSNGTVGLVLKKIDWAGLGITPFIINGDPDGGFPAHGPNPLAGGALAEAGKEVVSQKADLGAVFDADGDRVFFIDDLGRPVDGSVPTALISRSIPGRVVIPVDLGLQMREVLAKEGKNTVDSVVGHYFIKKLMKSEDVGFGAERSGHYYFKEFFYLDSGLFAALKMISEVASIPGPLSSWIDGLPKIFASGEANFLVSDKKAVMERVRSAYRSSAVRFLEIDGLSGWLGSGSDEWWFSLRASNTEDLLRLNLEARRPEVFKARFSEMENLIKK